MNVEVGAEAALFPEKEYIKGIFVAVWIQWDDSKTMAGPLLIYFPSHLDSIVHPAEAVIIQNPSEPLISELFVHLLYFH